MVLLWNRLNCRITIINGSKDDTRTYGAQALDLSSADGLADIYNENYEPNTDSSILEAIKRINRKYTNEGSIDKDGVRNIQGKWKIGSMQDNFSITEIQIKPKIAWK